MTKVEAPAPNAASVAGAPLILHVDGRGVATLTLDRPDVLNAFDEALIASIANSAPT